MGRILEAVNVLFGEADNNTQERAHEQQTDQQIFTLAQYQAVSKRGITDAGRPTDTQVKLFSKGLFAALIRLRADSIGGAVAKSQVMRRAGQQELVPVEFTHPWVKLLIRPNNYRPADQIWRWVSMARDYTGSADFVIETNGNGIPIALHEIFPEFGKLQEISDGKGGTESYNFIRADGKEMAIAANLVIRLKHPDTITPYGTASLLERAAYQLDKTLYADIYERDMLKDGRFPPVVLTTDQPINKAQSDRYGKDFMDSYMVTGDIHRIPVLGMGLEAKVTGVNANDLALLESQAMTQKLIFWITGVNPGMLDATANRSNADSARFVFSHMTVAPEANAIVAQLALGLEKAFGADPGALMIRVPDVVPVDEMQQSLIDEIKIRSGTMVPNEARERDGDVRYQGVGDMPMTTAAMIPLEAAESF